MGCAFSHEKKIVLTRMLNYERESIAYLNTLNTEPGFLIPENYDNFISVHGFYNLLHAGFYGPYVANPKYVLIVDFRSFEDFAKSRVISSIHHSHVDWYSEMESLRQYLSIILYDEDGTNSANTCSYIKRTLKKLSSHKIEANCLLGGLKALIEEFPYLITTTRLDDDSPRETERIKECSNIVWMPTFIRSSVSGRLFLGNMEQANNSKVAENLNLSHIISIGKIPQQRQSHIGYFSFDGRTNLYRAMEEACMLLRTISNQNGRVLVHGAEGLNRSAAVIVAYLMITGPYLLDEAYFYLQVQRPFLSLDDESLFYLSLWEKAIFGEEVTDVNVMWM